MTGAARRTLRTEGALLLLIGPFRVVPSCRRVTTSLKAQVVALPSPPAPIFAPTLAPSCGVPPEDRVRLALVNSLIVSIASSLRAVGPGGPAAHARARLEVRGQRDLRCRFVTNRSVPPVVLAFPVFLIAREIGPRDTHLALILMDLTFTLPIVIRVSTDRLRAIPRELDGAARLEGASQGRIFRSIALPLAAPGIAVSGILSFIFSRNERLFAHILAPKKATPAPAMAVTLMEGCDVPRGKIMATATLIAGPAPAVAPIAPRHLVRGLAAGAGK